MIEHGENAPLTECLALCYSSRAKLGEAAAPMNRPSVVIAHVARGMLFMPRQLRSILPVPTRSTHMVSVPELPSNIAKRLVDRIPNPIEEVADVR